MDKDLENINAIRMLAVDMIENAKSGHPGIALGCAPILYTLFSKQLNVVPEDDKNILRDRFILSAGHGSSILYAMLYAFGYKISIDDLKNFRHMGSKTPGHPEVDIVPGVDATTGPLGQGVSMAVGMAIAERMMANRFNKPDLTLFNNYTYTLVGEGCLMEGVSYESLALAGTLQLNKLIVLYDCNKVTLDSSINGVMNQDIIAYMTSLGFNCLEVKDGNNITEINEAIAKAKNSKDKPTFIKINTHIGYGSPLQDSNKSHGSVLGEENCKILRENLGVKTNSFDLGKDVNRDLVFLRKRFDSVRSDFKDRMKSYSKYYPGDYKLLMSYIENNFDNIVDVYKSIKLDKELSGREIGSIVLNELCTKYSNIICGAADLSGSTKVKYNNNGFINENFANRNIKFGVREFGMDAICNGIALYGGLVPIDSTFMVFSDYMKPALRLGSMMQKKAITILTHDSIAVGEDGATHEPSEQLWALREIPKLNVFRPANLTEIFTSFETALKYEGKSAIVLSRQKIVNFDSNYNDAIKGGYIVEDGKKRQLNGVIIATGSEVSLALAVKKLVENRGYSIRVVSMPSTEVFDSQSEKYRNNIIPKELKSIFSIEAGSTSGWYRFTGKFGKCFGVDDFGYSGKPEDIYRKFGLTIENISKEIIKVIRNNRDKILTLIDE